MKWMRAWVLILGTLLFSTPALAQDMTLAVLPLDKASASEEYAGLGKALAGMLVTDLSAVPGITLVERERLQALLDELELNKGEFVDPKSAQKLGKGVGARFVLTGSFSVVGQQFVLDARVVSVESGQIYKAADAAGQITDFVSVEKDLVENLLVGLAVSLSSSVKRQLYSVAPTEDFDAFSAYGAGIEAQDAGDLEAARAAYERAVAADPEFVQARNALAGVKAAMAEYLAERNVKYDTAYRAMNLKVLDSTVDMREYSGPLDMNAMTGFALRLSALENEGMDCQRMAEMEAYLERVDFEVAKPEPLPGKDEQGRPNGVLGYDTGKLAKDLGFVRYERGAGGPAMASQSETRAAGLFRDMDQFIFDDEWHDIARFEPTSAYLSSMSRCFQGEELLAELDRFAEELDARPAFEVSDRGYLGNVPMDLRMDALWLIWSAKQVGSSTELGRRSEIFLSRIQLNDPASASDAEKAVEKFGMSVLDEMVRSAKWRDQFNATMYGNSPEYMAEWLAGFVAKDPDYVVLNSKNCSYFLNSQLPSARSSLKEYQEELAEEDWFWAQTNLSRGVVQYGPMRDMGCVPGEEAQYTTLAQAMPLLRGAVDAYERTPLDPDDTTCASFGSGFSQAIDSFEQNLSYISGSPTEPQVLASMLGTYHQMNNFGCINPP